MMLISVVIPCYNVEKFIAECLASVVTQTYDQIEIICIDDGSTDNTLSLIQQFSDDNSRDIKVVSQSNRGQCAARNAGAKIAHGDFIHFLDADDLMESRKIENVVHLIKNHKTLPSFIVGDYVFRPYDGDEILKRADNRNGWYGLFSTNLGITSSITWRGKSLESVNYWNEKQKTSVEYELMFRLLKNGHQFIHDRDPQIIVRERKSGSITQNNLRENLIRYINLRLRMLNHLKENNLLENELEEHAMNALFTAIKRLYKYDPVESRKLYKTIIPNTFFPNLSSPLSKKYLLTLNLFGYRITQKLWEFYQSVFKKA